MNEECIYSYLESPLLDELDSFGDKVFPESRSKRVLIAFFLFDDLFQNKFYG